MEQSGREDVREWKGLSALEVIGMLHPEQVGEQEGQEGSQREVLAVDVRCFVEFNQGHLASSVNVCVPQSLARRKNLALTTVEASIACTKARDRFKHRHGADLVLYDSDSHAVLKNSLLDLLLHKISLENTVHSIAFLRGGFAALKEEFPHMCTFKETKAHPGSSPLLMTPRIQIPLCTPRGSAVGGKDSREEATAVEILDFLFLGSQEAAHSQELLQKHKITHILNVAQECQDAFAGNGGLRYKRLDLVDHARQDLDLALLDDAFGFIEEARRTGNRVLVHCRAGQSRSATIVITYLMRTRRWSLDKAYSFVQQKRPCVAPNLGFMAQIARFEKAEFPSPLTTPVLVSS